MKAPSVDLLHRHQTDDEFRPENVSVSKLMMNSDLKTSPFLFDGIHPVCLEGRFLRARFTTRDKKKVLSIEEFKQDIHSGFHQISHLYAEYVIPLPENICKRDKDRLLGTPVCIGSQGNTIILQYTTEREPLIQFMIVDVETKLVQACKMTCRHFLREYVLTAPLECYLDTATPSCLIRLSPAMLRTRRSLAIQSVVFKSSSSPINGILTDVVPTGDGMAEFVDVKSVINSRFLNILPFEPGKVVLVTVDEFAIKFSFDVLDTTSLMTSKLATHVLRSESPNSNLHQCKACRTREGDVICVACVTVDKMEDETSIRALRVFMFDKATFEILSNYTFNVTKTFKSTAEREIMLTMSACDTMFEIWAVKRKWRPVFIKSLKTGRRSVSLKSLCRSAILQHTKEWDLETLSLPVYLLQYLRFRLR